MIGEILGGLGAATGLAGSLFGMSKSAKAAKAANKRLDESAFANEAWYKRNYYQDPTQRADARRLLTMTQDAVRQANRNSAGRNAVMGGTGETRAADKEANNKVYSDAVGRVTAANEARKDSVDDTYRKTQQTIADKRAGVDMQRATSLALGAEGMGQSLMGLASLAAGIETPKAKRAPAAMDDDDDDPLTRHIRENGNHYY